AVDRLHQADEPDLTQLLGRLGAAVVPVRAAPYDHRVPAHQQLTRGVALGITGRPVLHQGSQLGVAWTGQGVILDGAGLRSVADTHGLTSSAGRAGTVPGPAVKRVRMRVRQPGANCPGWLDNRYRITTA